MANSTGTIDVLLKDVADPALRTQLADAVNALRKQTSFGLVFEKHHPEVSRLPEVTVRKSSLVARRNEKGNVLYRVENITKGRALCLPKAENEIVCSIIEPHDISDSNSWCIATGLAEFAKEHGDRFDRIELTVETAQKIKKNDLARPSRRKRVQALSANEALKALFSEIG